MGAQGMIRCPSCDHANRADRRYCAKCGSRLGEACAACGTQNEPDEHFCGHCGAALSGTPAPTAGGAAAGRAPTEAERRHLTVMFCDLVASTTLAERIDDEDLRELVRRYYDACAETIGRYDGHLANYLGDGVLAYFGYPRAHEDDAERAVRAALDMLGTLARDFAALNATLEAERGVRFAARIGVHTGPVVVGDMAGGPRREAVALGETVNLAARLGAAAAPDTVVISGSTLRLVRGIFVTEDLGRHAFKGISEPVPVYRVVQPSVVRSRLATAAALGLTPFIGREDERRLLRMRFEQACEGEGQVVLLVGEPGIGKSRLALVLHEDLAGVPHTWLESGGQPYFADTPFYAGTELLKQLLAWTGEDTAEARVAALERALAAAGLNAQQALPLVAPLLDLPVPKGYPPVLAAPDVARRRLIATLAAWVLGAARLQPLVVFLEDLQWVDPSTLELQQLLVEQGATAPLLLLYTARPEFRPPWALRAHHTQLTLSRLPRKHVREMVARVAARTALPEALVDAVVTRTDGVPLFVEELTKVVVEAGGEAAKDIPATLADSLMARLDRLGPAAKEVAQVGAVLGRQFSYGLLHAVHPVSDAELEGSLGKLADAELLYVRGLPPESSYLFKHTLVQDAAYGSLLKSRRRALHGRVAQVLAEQFPEVAEAQAELLAHHYEEAGDVELAVAYYRRAGEQAARSAHEEAIQHLRKAITLLGSLSESIDRGAREVSLQLALGTSLIAVRGYAHAKTEGAYVRAHALAQHLGTAAQLFTAMQGLSTVYYNRGELDRGIELAEQALRIAQQTGEATHLIPAHGLMVDTLFLQGKFAISLEHCERMIALYDPSLHRGLALGIGDADQAAIARCSAAWNLWPLGHPDRALARAEEATGLARRVAHPFSLAFALFCEALVHWWRGDLESQRELAEQTIALSEAHGFTLAGRGPCLAGGSAGSRGGRRHRYHGNISWPCPCGCHRKPGRGPYVRCVAGTGSPGSRSAQRCSGNGRGGARRLRPNRSGLLGCGAAPLAG